jgi:integrase
MPAEKLTDSTIAKAKPGPQPYYLRDGKRLSVLVSVAGSKTWVWGYRAPNGKERVYNVGKFPVVSCSAARMKRLELAEQVRSGVDPQEEKKADKVAAQTVKPVVVDETFWPLVKEWLSKKKAWSPYYRAQAERFLERYVQNTIGAMPVHAIKVSHVHDLLSGIANREVVNKALGEVKDSAPHIAIRLRSHLDGIFRLAVVKGKADRNLIKDVGLSEVLGDEKPKTKHNTKLKPAQLGDLLAKLDQRGGTDRTRIALKLLLLTFCRTAELRKSTWDEFDLDQALWIVPASHMKMGIEHTVPLSKQAVALLRELRKAYGGKGLLFANAKDPKKLMDPNTLNHALTRLGFAGEGTAGFTCHGCRGTASTLLNSMTENKVRKYPRDVIEAQLAHKVRGVEGAYNDADYLEQRVPMMQDWADYLDGLRANVVAVDATVETDSDVAVEA